MVKVKLEHRLEANDLLSFVHVRTNESQKGPCRSMGNENFCHGIDTTPKLAAVHLRYFFDEMRMTKTSAVLILAFVNCSY